jgi:hypothetical protein
MSHQIDPILRRRSFVLMILRSVAVVLLIIALYSFAYPIVRSIQIGRGLQSAGLIFADQRAWFGIATGTLLPGLAMAFFSRWIARWIVPGIRDECPNCGYAVGDHAPARCPECGYRLRHD